MLKLRASIGNPGNQSFDSAQSLLTYSFQFGSMNYFGLGAELAQVGNPDLEWQITVDKNIGLDVTLFNKRFFVDSGLLLQGDRPVIDQGEYPVVFRYGDLHDECRGTGVARVDSLGDVLYFPEFRGTFLVDDTGERADTENTDR